MIRNCALSSRLPCRPCCTRRRFGLAPGVNVLDKMVATLKLMGADEVYDTTFAADMTVMEETAEFLQRLGGRPVPDV